MSAALAAPWFDTIAELLKTRSGLSLGRDKLYLLETRLAPVLKRERLPDLAALAARLRSPAQDALARDVIEAMTTNETLFFRDEKPFLHLRTTELPRLLEARTFDAPIRIWSAAASTGQEAYSIAMLVDDLRPQIGNRPIEIVATDIAREPLARAREGLYSQFEVQRGLPAYMLARHFRREEGGWRISPALRQAVQFREWNLLADLRPLGQFDVVFCRNVLIYFDQDTKTRILEAIAERMAGDGVLFLGGAETVLGITDRFRAVPDLQGVYYPRFRPTPASQDSLTASLTPSSAVQSPQGHSSPEQEEDRVAASYRIAVIPGDGIGKETVPESIKVLDAAARRFGFNLRFSHYDWSCETYKKTGSMMPADGLEQLAEANSILLGAVGWPGVPDHISLWGLLIPIRRGFDQYVNLRPCRLMPGVRTPLANRTEADIDFYVVRENTEGEYSSVGGRMFAGTEREFVSQQSVFTRKGVDRILKFAFELARTRPKKHLTSATKSNGITFTMPYWDERFAEMGKQYPDIRTDQYHVDILTAHFVQHPDWFDVVVGSNLFGDILSDLGPAVAGSIGIAPSANINPEREHPSMFEPVHGSAPDIAGKHICNPIGQIWSAAMMLQHLGEKAAGDAIVRAIETLLREGGPRTRDMGGQAGTAEVGDALAELVASL